MSSTGSMYLVLPVPVRVVEGRMLVESQAANGLDRWADHFAQVVVGAPLLPEDEVGRLAGFVWKGVETLEHRDRIRVQPLPWAYTPLAFAGALGETRRLIGQTIASCGHLQFAIGGLVGDWAAVAALEAIRLGRRYAIHTDRVEHEVLRKVSAGASLPRRLRAAVEVPLMERYHEHVIRHCTLGLWHGDDCFRAYAPWCGESHLIHDVHTKADDAIPEDELEGKVRAVRKAGDLQICYAGRLDPMKAPLEWLGAIAAARAKGAAVHATWYGDGPLLEQAKAERARLGLEDVVEYPGFVAGRGELLQRIRSAHAFVFTHITPESPRNLIEALVSGTPILGYGSPYSVNLLDEHGGGATVPVHDADGLGQLIAELGADRERLAGMVREAAANGCRFSDAAVFRERSELIQRYA